MRRGICTNRNSSAACYGALKQLHALWRHERPGHEDFGTFTPDLEIYSIDEAFLGPAGVEIRLETHARELRRTVLQWTGIPVSIGIAFTKTLAKVANRCAKKDAAREGIFVMLDEKDIEVALSQMDLKDLWGVAGRMAARLNALGIHTPLQLRDLDPAFVRECVSVVMQRMVMELRGTVCLSMEATQLRATPAKASWPRARLEGRSPHRRNWKKPFRAMRHAPQKKCGGNRSLALRSPCSLKPTALNRTTRNTTQAVARVCP